MTSEIGRICLSSNLRKNSKSYLLLNLCRKVIFFWTYVEKFSSFELMSKSYLFLNLCRKIIFFWTYVEKLSSSELMSKIYLLQNLCRKVIFFWTYVEKLSSSELMSKKSCYQYFRPFTKNFKKNLLALFSIMFGFVSTVEELSIEQLNAYHSKDKLNNSRQNFRLMSIKKKKDRNEFEMVIKMFCYNDPNISLEQIS